MRALIVAAVLFNLSNAIAKSDDVKLIGSSFDYGGHQWRVDHRVNLYIKDLDSTIRNGSDFYRASDQNLHLFRPEWDFLGLIEQERNNFYYESNPDKIYYADAKIAPSASVRIFNGVDYEYKPEIESIVINGFSVCDNSRNDQCHSSSYDWSDNESLEVEISYIWDDVVAGKPLRVDVGYSKPLKDSPPYRSTDDSYVFSPKKSYLLSTKEVSLIVQRNVSKGTAEKDQHNDQVDYERAGIISAAKWSYFIYIAYVIVGLVFLYNLRHLYFFTINFFIYTNKVLRVLFEYPKSVYIWFKSKIFKEKSILTKSDGFTKVSVSEELMRWNQLKDSKIISEEEFTTVKENLLESLRKGNKN